MSQLPPIHLKPWRIARRKGLRQLARECGLDHITVYRIEHNPNNRPHPATVEKLAAALGITVFDLYREPTEDDSRAD